MGHQKAGRECAQSATNNKSPIGYSWIKEEKTCIVKIVEECEIVEAQVTHVTEKKPLMNKTELLPCSEQIKFCEQYHLANETLDPMSARKLIFLRHITSNMKKANFIIPLHHEI